MRLKLLLPALIVPGLLAVLFLSLDETAGVSRAAGNEPSVISTVLVGGGGRLHDVAVNPTTHRIYTANEDSNNVAVIDGITNAVVATVDLGASP